jgi:hypothetical protein
MYDPFGGFAGDAPVESGRVGLPEIPEFGFETR